MCCLSLLKSDSGSKEAPVSKTPAGFFQVFSQMPSKAPCPGMVWSLCVTVKEENSKNA